MLQIQKQSFRIVFDATPSAANVDAVTGISTGVAATFSDLATAVRFNASGAIDAMNGSSYGAVSVIQYAANVTYHFILDVNVPTHTYSATVMIGSSPALIGKDLAFRTQQAATLSLGELAAMTNPGTHTVCNMLVSAIPIAPSITTQPAPQSVTVGQAATFSVATTGTTPMTYQWSKNGSALSGAISSSYTSALTATADNGSNFTVVISNAAGTVTSKAATLTVSMLPQGLGCALSSTSWISAPLAQRQTAKFRVSFDSTPSA